MIALLILAGCVAGFREGKPSSLYETLPQARTFVELGHVQGRTSGYGMSGQTAFDGAMQKMMDRADALGADGVVNAKGDGKCNGWIIFGLPNCSGHADGIAVKWDVVPERTPPTVTP